MTCRPAQCGAKCIAAWQIHRKPLCSNPTPIGLYIGSTNPLDLRGSTEDYANEIEPSTRGGEKIAQSIAKLVATRSVGAVFP